MMMSPSPSSTSAALSCICTCTLCYAIIAKQLRISASNRISHSSYYETTLSSSSSSCALLSVRWQGNVRSRAQHTKNPHKCGRIPSTTSRHCGGCALARLDNYLFAFSTHFQSHIPTHYDLSLSLSRVLAAFPLAFILRNPFSFDTCWRCTEHAQNTIRWTANSRARRHGFIILSLIANIAQHEFGLACACAVSGVMDATRATHLSREYSRGSVDRPPVSLLKVNLE